MPENNRHSKWSYDSETKIITTKPSLYAIQPKGVGYFIYENFKKHLNNVAQINVLTGETDTYAELLQKCIRTAIELRSRGVKAGDVIVSCSYYHRHCAVVYIAATFIGAKICNMDPAQPAADIKYFLNLLEPKFIFVSENCEDLIVNLKLASVVVAYDDCSKSCTSTFSEFLLPNEIEDTFRPYECNDPKETILILLSSGTTGLPKGICWNHEQLIFESTKSFTPRSLGKSTLYWIQPSVILVSSIYSGTARCYFKEFDAALIWEQIEKYEVGYVFLTPFYVMEMMNHKPPGHVTTLKTFSMSGGGTSDENFKKIRACMPNTVIVATFGLTEAGRPFAHVPLGHDDKLQVVGSPGFGYSYKIVNPETEENLGYNMCGELRFKNKYTINGYFKMDSFEAFDAEGYLKTGDLGYYDEDFNFYIVDRIKEMFKYRGIHVVPAKLEKILMDNPAIKAAAVIGIPHVEDENHGMAVVVLNNAARITEEDVEKYFNDRVADYERLRAGVKILNALPVTVSGKIARNLLKKMIICE